MYNESTQLQIVSQRDRLSQEIVINESIVYVDLIQQNQVIDKSQSKKDSLAQTYFKAFYIQNRRHMNGSI